MSYTESSDRFVTYARTADSPARDPQIVTPSDTVDLVPYAKALKCNADGTIYILPVGAYRAGVLTPVPWVVQAGEYVPVQVARVFLTGTTLTTSGDIVAL